MLMTIDRHIYFTVEEYNRINEYADKHNLSFSKAVCNLSINALNGDDISEKIAKVEKNTESIIKKQKVIQLLEEQIYSDMDFNNITDPKKSKPLAEFNKKIRNHYIGD